VEEAESLTEETVVILTAVAARMSKLPYAEPQEETRIMALELVRKVLDKNPKLFISISDKICTMLAALLEDANPDMKTLAAAFATALALEEQVKAGKYFRETIAKLTLNLQHNHSKVRKATLLALKEVVAAKGAETHADLPLAQLKQNCNDRSSDVRKTLYFDLLPHWLTNVEFETLKIIEKDLIQLLLNGIADEIPEISLKALATLEEYGKNMREALKAQGEAMEQ